MICLRGREARLAWSLQESMIGGKIGVLALSTLLCLTVIGLTLTCWRNREINLQWMICVEINHSSFTLSLTTHSLTNPFSSVTQPFIHFTLSSTNSFTYSFISLIHSTDHSQSPSTFSLTQSFSQSSTHSLIHLLIHFTHTLDRSLSLTQHLLTNSVFLTVINSLAHSPTHSFHSYTRPITFTHPAPSH